MKQLFSPLVLFFALFITTSLLSPAPATARNTDMADEILYLVNKHRQRQGLSPLQMVSFISDEAQAHSSAMASRRIPLGHSGFDSRMARIMKRLPGSNAAAENVAFGASSAKEVVDMWLHSRGHRRNIEGRYNLTGIGIARGRNGDLYFTQIFIYRR